MSYELKVLDEAVEIGTQKGCYAKKHVVAIDHALETLGIQLKEREELKKQNEQLIQENKNLKSGTNLQINKGEIKEVKAPEQKVPKHKQN